MDGSQWIKGICVLSAADESAALDNFHHYLAKNLMEEIEVYEIKHYLPENYADHPNARNIAHAVRVATDRGETAYIGLMTSEGEADE